MAATTAGSTLDIFNLLRFPSSSDALSAYKSGSVASDLDKKSPPSGSPPRKTARLECDQDHHSSVARARIEEKGKKRAMVEDVQGTKHLIIKIGSPHLKGVDDDYLESLLPVIHKSICAILSRTEPDFTSKCTPFSYERIFQATRSIVLISKRSQWVYEKLKFEFKEAAVQISKSLLMQKTSSMVDWLERLVLAATWFNQCITLLEGLLSHLDRMYLAQKHDLQRIRPLGMGLFQAHVFQHASIVASIKLAIKEWAIKERTDRTPHIKRQVLVAFVRILSEYSLFSEYFLVNHLDETRKFYENESDRLSTIMKDNPGEFLVHCAERINEENVRSREALSGFEFCWHDISKAIEKSLLDGRLTWLSLGVEGAVQSGNRDGLARMYNLFSRVDGQKLLCNAFKLAVRNKVAAIVSNKERDEEMVDDLLKFKEFIDTTVPIAFSDPEQALAFPADSEVASSSKSASIGNGKMTVNKDFVYAATDAFMTGFRVRRNKPAEMIAKFLDRAMRRGQKGSSDEEFAKILDSALGLYRFTEDKDVFRTFYHRALAKRLLLQRSASDDFEKSVLKKLKEQFDPEFSMGDHMFRDLALSRDFMEEFHSKPIGEGSAKNLSVMVLQASFWPFSAKQKSDALLPAWMQGDLIKYVQFYKNKHQGHKLDFDHSLGTVQMRAHFNSGYKELSVSLFQAVVLLLFNDQDEMGFHDIKLSVGVEDAELRRTLQSLACGNKKVLKKRPAGRDVNDADVFYFNREFSDPRAKVHINSIQVKETIEESKKTQDAIDGDRKHYLDAAIVRVMKAKKTMGHQALVTATIDAVKAHFAPEVRMIKERFEQLIEQEYMRRDEEQDNVYVYVA